MDQPTAPATDASRKRSITLYVHKSKDSNYESAMDDGFGTEMSDEAMASYVYTAYEVRLDCEVNLDTGKTVCLGVEGVKLERPVEI